MAMSQLGDNQYQNYHNKVIVKSEPTKDDVANLAEAIISEFGGLCPEVAMTYNQWNMLKTRMVVRIGEEWFKRFR